MEKYLITSTRTPDLRVLVWLAGNQCMGFCIESGIEPTDLDRINFTFNMLIGGRESIEKALERNKHIRFEKVIEELNFELFWNEYAYKVDRKKAEVEWNKLTEAERQSAFKAYKAFVHRKNTEMRYACRYLKDRLFESNFPA